MEALAARMRARRMHAILSRLHPEAEPLLAWKSPFQLLVAVILSAQCTDEQVNRVTPILFGRWPDPGALASAPQTAVEGVIRPAGFYRVKAGYIRGTARALVERHGGEVPDAMDDLTALPGVGRKSANLVRSACFGLPGIIADTHFTRVIYRSGVCAHRDPSKQEEEIARLLPPEDWTAFSHAVNRHGKFLCTARRPSCDACPIAALCLRRGVLEGPAPGPPAPSPTKRGGRKPR